MAQGIEKYKKGDREAVKEITENAGGYIQLLEQHIDKEDNILYMMADAHLSRKKQKELLEGFERIEEEKIGKGKHEEFHEVLHHLKRVDLK